MGNIHAVLTEKLPLCHIDSVIMLNFTLGCGMSIVEPWSGCSRQRVELKIRPNDAHKTSSMKHLYGLALVTLLVGCGNAHEHLSMGEWREMGEASPPDIDEEEAFVVTMNAPGDGPAVRAGDLVKAIVTSTTVDDTASTRSNPRPQVIWVWTGREREAASPSDPGSDPATFGWLGGARPRNAFIGRRLHEKFEIHLAPGVSPQTGNLPVRGIIDYKFSRLNVAASIHGQWAGPPEWPELSLRDLGGGSPAARLEVLEICPARLWRRTAILTQFGFIFSVGDVRYGNSRRGILGWTALDAQCPGPDGHVRFQAGPFYEGRIRDPALLADWGASYKALRPPEKYPEEWQVVPKPAWQIINERLQPLTTKISVLQLQQEGARFNCENLKKCEDPQKHEQRRLERERLIAEAIQQRKQLECELEKKCDAGTARTDSSK